MNRLVVLSSVVISMNRLIILIMFILSSNTLKAQVEVYFKTGLNLQLGTHVNRIGWMYQIYVYNDFAQVSNAVHMYVNLNSLGPKGKFGELKVQLGAQGHWGYRRNEEDPAYSEFSNLSKHAYAAGYSFYLYQDGMRTSQTTGAIYGTMDQFRLAIDNDAFGTNPYEDKFRTGAFMLSWKQDSLLYSIQSTLWTGKSYDAPKVKDGDYPAKKGYRDPTDVKYGQYSHGILAARVDYVLPYYAQSTRFELGLDAEQIRNMVQNKMVHDLMPDRWVGYENPHYPMLQPDGSPYLYREGQRVRKPRLYLQLGANQSALY